MEENKRRQVSYDQLTALLEFLKEHNDLAKGLTRGRHRRGKFNTIKVWNLCSKKLNVIKGGALKDGKGWAKYWCDWKYRVRRRALEVKAALDSDLPPAEGILPLSPMEENIMSIIGETAVEGIVVMGDDPLSGGGLDEAIQHYENANEDHLVNDTFKTENIERNPRSRKRRQFSDETTGPSSSNEGAPKRSSKKRRKRPSINSDTDHDVPSPPEQKPEVVHEADGEDKAESFLSLEREKLLETNKIVNMLGLIHTDISKLTNILADIKDCFNLSLRQGTSALD